MKKYYTSSSLVNFGELNKKIVENEINAIQNKHPNAKLHSVQQSVFSEFRMGVAKEAIMFTIVMEEEIPDEMKD